MSLFSKTEKTAAVFDIGNGSVGVALVKFTPGQKPTIIYTYREPVTFLPHVAPKRLLGAMLKLLSSVSAHLVANGFKYLPVSYLGRGQIHDVFCVIAAPWYLSETKIIKVSKEAPFSITHDFINELLETEDKSFSTSAAAEEYQKFLPGVLDGLEKEVIHTTVNGYEIAEPLGKEAREFEMNMFLSLVSQNLKRAIEDKLRAAFHFHDIHFFSYALASWVSTRKMFPTAEDFLFLDVSNEATDAYLVAKGTLAGVKSFPTGRAAVLRAIIKNLKVLPDIAVSFLDLHVSGKAEKGLSDKIQPVLETAKTAWLEKLQETLKIFQQKYSLPKKVFVTADADVAHVFMKALEESQPIDLSIPQKIFDAMYLDGTAFKNFNHYLFNEIPDPFLSLETIFLGNRV